jgi:hypothetical protein
VWREFCCREHGPDLPRLLEAYEEVLNTSEPFLWRRTYKALRAYEIEIHFFTGPREGEMEKVTNTPGCCGVHLIVCSMVWLCAPSHSKNQAWVEIRCFV